MAVGVLVGVTAGLGGAPVSADLVQVRQVLGLSPTQAAWLSTSYVAAVQANLLLIKVRQQYGLRRFALVALGIYAAAALAQAWVTDVAAMLLLRAIGGFISVTLIPLCLFHTLQASPTKWRLRGLMLAIGIVTVAALVDGIGTGPLPMASLNASQSAIAFAGTFFLGPALLLGIMSALRQGSGALLSSIVLFGVFNALGALAGQALFGSYMDWRLAAGAAEQAARSDTMRLAAVLGLATTQYLAVLFLLRLRRHLAELRTEKGAGAASKKVAPAAGSGWTQPRVAPAIGAIIAALAIGGVILILAAFGQV